MGRTEKAVLYGILKDSGLPLTEKYTHYTVQKLKAELAAHNIDTDVKQWIMEYTQDEAAPVYANDPDPDELPGQRISTKLPEDVIRIDDQGRQWLQEEVRKPAFPKPRGRRVLKYVETGVTTKTVQNGDYVETFEVAGNLPSRPAEVKITLPSYQVGIYRDPRFPFKVHTYGGREGFDLNDVNQYYGGSELVPASIKRTYIENSLCYDIRSVVQAIQAELRQYQLSGRLK
jgi:hypothetical protein